MSNPTDPAALEDTLFLALTRPSMMFGVPSVGCMLNVTGSVIVSAWLGMGSWHILAWMICLMPSVHFLMRWAAARDHNWFRTAGLGIETKGHGTDKWGGSTLTPLPSVWPGTAKGMDV